MIRYSVAHASLYDSERFRRLLMWSVGMHLILMLLFVLAPSFYAPSYKQAPIFVDLVAAPAAPAALTTPRQVVDEPIVIPKRPRAKPKPVAPPPKPVPAVEKKKPTPAPAVSPEQILEQLRAKRASAAKSESETGRAPQTGIFNPQLAAYTKKIQNKIYANWIGVRPYAHRFGLEVIFEMELDAGGMLQSLRMVQSSGDRPLDESAERAIYKAAPFPPPPRGIRRITIRMNPREKV